MGGMNKLAIVGSHPKTRELAPFDDVKFDIMVFNEAPTAPWCKRWDICVQMHDEVIYTNPKNRCDPEHWAWLQKAHEGKRIYMQKQDERIPASVTYPLDLVLTFLKSERFFTSGIAYGMALAAFLGYEEIHLYGVEMASQTEYFQQRECTAYWMGFLTGRGIHFVRHCADSIFDRMLYGYEGQIDQKLEEYIARQDELRAMLHKAIDTEREAQRLVNRALDEPANLPDALNKILAATIDRARIEGASEEIDRYAIKVEAMIKEAGRAILDRNEFEAAQARENGEKGTAHEERKTMVHVTRGRMDVFVSQHARMNKPETAQVVKDYLKIHLQAAQEFGYHDGIAQENARLKHILDERFVAAGGAKSLEAVKEQ